MCPWVYLLKNNQVQQIVKCLILSTLRTHIHNMSRSGSEIVGELLTNLSKAFDCLPRWHLIAKLEEYGFSKISNIGLGLVFNYLPNHKQMVKINESFSSWSEILFGVPQDPILGLLLFNFLYVTYFISLRIIKLQSMQMTLRLLMPTKLWFGYSKTRIVISNSF